MKAHVTVLAIAAALACSLSAPVHAQQGQDAYYASPGPAIGGSALQVSDSARTTISDATRVSRAASSCTDSGCGCGDCGNCGDCGSCCKSLGVWGGVEYLHVWTKGSALPALVTTSPNGALLPVAGVLPAATVLFGQDRVGNELQSAGRATLGLWLDDCETTGIGVRFLGLEGDRTRFMPTSPTADPILARPFFNIGPVNAQDALLVAFPGLSTGNIDIRTSNDVYTTDAFLRINLGQDCDYRIDAIGGYHYTLIDDGLTVRSTSRIAGGVLPVGTLFDFQDAFNARNSFHGGSFGLLGEYGNGPWTVSMMAKMSVGRNYETVVINGRTTVMDVGGGVAVTNGGLLAQPTNIGTFTRTETVFVPEATLSLNRRLNRNWDMSVGYTFIYWSSVLLAGDQIDQVNGIPVVNSAQLNGGALAGAARPAFNFVDTDYWLHGISFGLNFRY